VYESVSLHVDIIFLNRDGILLRAPMRRPLLGDGEVDFTFTGALQAERMRAILPPPPFQTTSVRRPFADGVDVMC
jgi:hypothetical protein